jgi:hypothetical protein
MRWGLGNLSSDDLGDKCLLKASYIRTASEASNYNNALWVGTCAVKNKLYNTLLLSKAFSHKRDTPSAPPPPLASALNYKRQGIGVLRLLAQVCACLWRVFHFQYIYALRATSVRFVQIFVQFTKNLEHWDTPAHIPAPPDGVRSMDQRWLL